MRPIIILGGGGHAKVLIESLLLTSADIIGFTSKDEGNQIAKAYNIKHLGDDDSLHLFDPKTCLLVNGIGSIGSPGLRKLIFERYKAFHYNFCSVINPNTILSKNIMFDEGVQVMAGAIVQPRVTIGRNSIINTGSIIEHDCSIGEHVHVAPGVTLSGSVSIGCSTHIGTGAKVIQGVKIGEGCIIGAGAVVIRDVPNGAKVIGVPAKEVTR